MRSSSKDEEDFLSQRLKTNGFEVEEQPTSEKRTKKIFFATKLW